MRRLEAIFAVLLLIAAGALPALADEWGAYVTGEHVYDRANVLSTSQIQTLEAKADALDSLGAPTIVYIRVQDATLPQAQQQAGDLMDAWDVESSRDAHDGFVLLVDLATGNTQHGQVGLYAGAAYAGTLLPGDELDNIASSKMRPALVQGDLAAGIGAGLDAVANDLRDGSSGSFTSTSTSTQSRQSWLLSSPWLPFGGWILICALIVLINRRFGRRGRRTGHYWSNSSGWYSSGGGDSGGGASSGGDSGGTSF
jgi:uncharacterized membrane protein YgcG